MFTLLLQTTAIVPDPMSWLTSLPSLGVGGAIGVLCLSFYRIDRKASEERLNELNKNFLQVIQDNTKAMTSVVDAVNRLS